MRFNVNLGNVCYPKTCDNIKRHQFISSFSLFPPIFYYVCVNECEYMFLVINFHKFIYTNEPFRPSTHIFVQRFVANDTYTHLHTWHIAMQINWKAHKRQRLWGDSHVFIVTFVLYSLGSNFYFRNFVHLKSICRIDPI